MLGTAKIRVNRAVQKQVSGTSGASLNHVDEQVLSALKNRRIKKGKTAAQAQGKVTGRWTDEEHERFQEGKKFR